MAAAAAKADGGQEKVIAAAHHIVKSLATSKNAEDDMIRILAAFDNRLSTMNGRFPSGGEAESDVGGGGLSGGACEPSETDARINAAEAVILRWESSNSDSLLWEASHEEATEYLSAVDEIIALASPHASPSGDLRSRAENLLQIAMSQLEDDFRHLMIRNTVPLEPRCLYSSISRRSISMASDGGDTIEDFDPSVEEEEPESNPEERGRGRGRSRSGSGSGFLEDWNIDLIHPEAVSDLKDIADRMIWSGYGRELCQVYCSVRREILDECLSVLGVDRMSIEEVQRLEWGALDDKMKKWIQAVKFVSRVLLLEERRLCDQIFAESDKLEEECFKESAKGCVMQLLNFGDAIAIGRRSSEKLFGILDMCEALTDVLTDLQDLFPRDSSEFICGEADGILSRLGDAVRATLAEFGNAIQREPSRKPMQGCEIHPLTRYVMNYLKLLGIYKSSLDLVLDESGVDRGDCSENGESMTPTARRLLLLISYLESNLEEKSKLYEDGGMKYVFLMNNLLYIVQKVKDSELRTFLGDDWIRKRRGQIRQYSTSYLRTSWTKGLSYLKDEGLGGSRGSNSGSRTAIKEKFKSFNSAFEEIHRTQIAWKVSDPQLREELRISISEKIIPAYRSFMGRFGSQLEGGRHAAKYIKYTSEDLENHLSDLFEGLPVHLSLHRRKLSS